MAETVRVAVETYSGPTVTKIRILLAPVKRVPSMLMLSQAVSFGWRILVLAWAVKHPQVTRTSMISRGTL